MNDYTQKAERDALRLAVGWTHEQMLAIIDACDALEARAEALEHRPDCVAGEGTTHWYRCEERIAALERERDMAQGLLQGAVVLGGEQRRSIAALEKALKEKRP